jgi:hypothetical protein
LLKIEGQVPQSSIRFSRLDPVEAADHRGATYFPQSRLNRFILFVIDMDKGGIIDAAEICSLCRTSSM